MNTIGRSHPWSSSLPRSTGGDGNHSLEGIRVRAPDLHNGPVPTLDDLLRRPTSGRTSSSPATTCYDEEHVGFVGDVPGNARCSFIEFDT